MPGLLSWDNLQQLGLWSMFQVMHAGIWRACLPRPSKLRNLDTPATRTPFPCTPWSLPGLPLAFANPPPGTPVPAPPPPRPPRLTPPPGSPFPRSAPLNLLPPLVSSRSHNEYGHSKTSYLTEDTVVKCSVFFPANSTNRLPVCSSSQYESFWTG